MMNATEKIIAYFKDNEELFNSCIEELDSYNGYLRDDRYYDMYMIDELYHGVEPSELMNRIYYGYDEDSSTENNYTEFNPNRDYFRYNGYGNLVSANWKDYSAHLDSWCIESMSENRNYIVSIESDPELVALFDELESENNDTEPAENPVASVLKKVAGNVAGAAADDPELVPGV